MEMVKEGLTDLKEVSGIIGEKWMNPCSRRETRRVWLASENEESVSRGKE